MLPCQGCRGSIAWHRGHAEKLMPMQRKSALWIQDMALLLTELFGISEQVGQGVTLHCLPLQGVGNTATADERQ